MQTKQTVLELLERLPDDCTIDDVLYHLYVIQSAQAGLADLDRGHVLSHEAVAEALRRRWQGGGVQ